MRRPSDIILGVVIFLGVRVLLRWFPDGRKVAAAPGAAATSSVPRRATPALALLVSLGPLVVAPVVVDLRAELGIRLADETLRIVGAGGRLERALDTLDAVADHRPALFERLVVLPLSLLVTRPVAV